MSGSFAELSSIKGNEVEKPKPLAPGHYSATFAGPIERRDSKDKSNFAMRFPIQLTEAHDDVDAEALAANPKGMSKKYNIDFWMSEDARYRFTEFAEKLGCDTDLGLIEMADWLVTEKPDFMVEVKNEPSQNDPTVVYTVIDNPAPLPA